LERSRIRRAALRQVESQYSCLRPRPEREGRGLPQCRQASVSCGSSTLALLNIVLFSLARNSTPGQHAKHDCSPSGGPGWPGPAAGCGRWPCSYTLGVAGLGATHLRASG
jgi:hypothetical protein